MNLTKKNLFTKLCSLTQHQYLDDFPVRKWTFEQFFIFWISKMFQISGSTLWNEKLLIFPTPEFWFITLNSNVRQKCDANLSKERVISIHVYYYYCEPISLLIIFFWCCTKWNNNLQFEIYSIPCSFFNTPVFSIASYYIKCLLL